MPAAGAGLIRFFQDDTHGIKIGPKAVVILSIAFVGIVMILHVLQI